MQYLQQDETDQCGQRWKTAIKKRQINQTVGTSISKFMRSMEIQM